MNIVTTTSELEAILGRPTAPIARKKATPPDEWMDAFMVVSTVVFWAGEDLRLDVVSAHHHDPARVDDVVHVPFEASVPAPIGSLWMAAGHLETLRLNGSMVDHGLLRVSEQFLHCSKAFRRGQIWTHPVPARSAADEYRFAVVATGADCTVDVSPRGDDPNVLHQLGPDDYLLVDRPGNRLGDAFHNLLANPSIEVALFGANALNALVLRGHANVVTDASPPTQLASGTGLALHITATERRTLPLPHDMWTQPATPPPSMAHVVSARSTGTVGAREVQRELDQDAEERLW
jgi:hypothetical protein